MYFFFNNNIKNIITIIKKKKKEEFILHLPPITISSSGISNDPLFSIITPIVNPIYTTASSPFFVTSPVDREYSMLHYYEIYLSVAAMAMKLLLVASLVDKIIAVLVNLLLPWFLAIIIIINIFSSSTLQ